jgi:signal transduction histidine kinase
MLRNRITLLAAALTSAVVIALVVPLCLLVRTMAEDRAVDAARARAQEVAALVANVSDEGRVAAALATIDEQAAVTTTVVLPSGRLLEQDADQDVTADPLADRARLSTAAFTERTSDGADVLVPIAKSAGVYVVHTHVGFSSIWDGVVAAWLTLAGLALVLLLGAVVIARRLAVRISTPVTEMADVAHRLRQGDLAARADIGGPTELVELGGALNRLAERIGELLASEREAAADLSHRLRTPVTALRLDADLVAEPGVGDRLRLHVDDLGRAIDTIVAEARRPSREAMSGACNARAILAERARHWTPLAEDQGRQVTVSLPEQPVLVALAAADLSDLVDNLVDNVFAHTPEGAPLAIKLAVGRLHARIRVEDGGTGMPSDVRVGRGDSGSGSTGLGLDIVRRLTHRAGGELRVETSTLGGLAVEASLRRADVDGH